MSQVTPTPISVERKPSLTTLGNRIRRFSQTRSRKNTIKPGETFDDLVPANLILSRLSKASVYLDSASTILSLVLDSLLGGAVGWFVNYVYTFGNFFSRQSAAEQSYASYCAGVMGWTSFLAGSFDCLVQAASMVRLHFLDQPDRYPTLRKCMWILVRRTWHVYLMTLVMTVAVAYGVTSLPSNTHFLKLHFYLTGPIIHIYTASLDVAYRRTYYRKTVEGQEREVTAKRLPYWKLIAKFMAKDAMLLVTTDIAALYIHISASLHLENSRELTIFMCVSYLFKWLIQKFTKSVIFKQKKTQVKTIYLAISVPTVLIDTQIRVVILRQPDIRQSIAGSLAISSFEILSRFAKVWFVRREIKKHEHRAIREIVTATPNIHKHDSGPNVLEVVRPALAWAAKEGSGRLSSITLQRDVRFTEFLQWRRRLLRFHAAEIHADMYAEYLAIVCSMSIYFFFHAHPKYAWSTQSTLLTGTQQALYLGLQIVAEMVVDYISCTWELANGVPIRNSNQMRAFITALFACCSVTNILLVASVCVKSS